MTVKMYIKLYIIDCLCIIPNISLKYVLRDGVLHRHTRFKDSFLYFEARFSGQLKSFAQLSYCEMSSTCMAVKLNQG